MYYRAIWRLGCCNENHSHKNDDHYIINGSKTFITNGVYSDYLIVAAKTDPTSKHTGMSLFILDREMPGITATKLDKLGWKASDTGEIAFDNVKVPSKFNGRRRKRLSIYHAALCLRKTHHEINAHARAEYAVDYTIQYMSQRKAFGTTIDKLQALRHKIADMASQVEMCKEFNYSIAKRLGQGGYVVKEASMSKLLSTKMADEVIYDALQLLGGYGYMEEYPMARLLRDSRLGPLEEVLPRFSEKSSPK